LKVARPEQTLLASLHAVISLITHIAKQLLLLAQGARQL
jgi:hypothetical protein